MAYNDGRFDHAVWDPISGRTTLGNTVTRMTIHTAATTSTDIYGPGGGPDGSYAHFYNPSSNRLRQHQEIHHKAYASVDANGHEVAVEHQDAGPSHGVPLTAKQIDDDARLFAHLVQHYGLPNRIATVDNTSGLAWHRLGISGNFGTYDPHNRRTWSRAQTGLYWSGVQGKVCPWDERIDQIDDIYDAAQHYISGHDPEEDDDMGTWKNTAYGTDYDITADGSWHTLTIGGTESDKQYSYMSGPALTHGVLNVSVTGLPKGHEVALRPIYVETKSGQTSKVVQEFPSEQTTSNGGTTQLALTFYQDIVGGSDGWVRRLRFQIRAHGGEEAKKVTVISARVRGLHGPR